MRSPRVERLARAQLAQLWPDLCVLLGVADALLLRWPAASIVAERVDADLLAASGARAIGQSDLRAISLHTNQQIFPYDAPDTVAGGLLPFLVEHLSICSIFGGHPFAFSIFSGTLSPFPFLWAVFLLFILGGCTVSRGARNAGVIPT